MDAYKWTFGNNVARQGAMSYLKVPTPWKDYVKPLNTAG